MVDLKTANLQGLKAGLEHGVSVHLKIPSGYNHYTYVPHGKTIGSHSQISDQGLNDQLRGYKYSVHIAALDGNTKILELLSQYNANLDIKASDGTTALSAATAANQAKAVTWLLEHGANPNQPLDDHSTALHLAAYHGHAEIMQSLLAYKADINTTDDIGETPLLTALFNKKTNTAKILIENGANVNKSNPNNASPLFFAAQNGLERIVKLLLQKNANPNQYRNSDNTGPLQIAALNGHLGTVKLLVEAGANIQHIDDDGFNAEQWAMLNRFIGIARYLRECQHKTSALQHSSTLFKSQNNEEHAKECYKNGKYMQAIGAFIKAINSTEPEKQPMIYTYLGHCFYELKNYQQAIANYSKAIELQPELGEAYEGRATTYRKLAEAASDDTAKLNYMDLAEQDEKQLSTSSKLAL